MAQNASTVHDSCSLRAPRAQQWRSTHSCANQQKRRTSLLQGNTSSGQLKEQQQPRAFAVAAPKNASVTHLCCMSLQGDPGSVQLARALKEHTNEKLVELDIGYNEIKDEGACALAQVRASRAHPAVHPPQNTRCPCLASFGNWVLWRQAWPVSRLHKESHPAVLDVVGVAAAPVWACGPGAGVP